MTPTADVLPDESNLFGSLTTHLDPEAVANLFAPFGWTVHRCSWTDFEVISDFAELVIEKASRGGVLIHGPVASVLVNVRRVIEPLAHHRIAYSLECYDARRELIGHLTGYQ